MGKAKRKPGRPKANKQLSVDDFFDEDGNPTGGYRKGNKASDALEFKKAVERIDMNEKSNGRGMYAGMADPESYLEFYKTSIAKPRKGRPWTYPTAAALQTQVSEYFEFCIDRKVAVTVAGLGAWLGVTTSTLRLWKQNQATMPFYEVIEPAIGFIHAMTEQGAMDGTVPVVSYIFSSKNYHGLSDKMDYQVLTTERISSIEQDDIIKQLPIQD